MEGIGVSSSVDWKRLRRSSPWSLFVADGLVFQPGSRGDRLVVLAVWLVLVLPPMERYVLRPPTHGVYGEDHPAALLSARCDRAGLALEQRPRPARRRSLPRRLTLESGAATPSCWRNGTGRRTGQGFSGTASFTG